MIPRAASSANFVGWGHMTWLVNRSAFHLTLVTLESIVAHTFVVSNALALARTNFGEIGCETEAMSDRTINLHPSFIALALVKTDARTMT